MRLSVTFEILTKGPQMRDIASPAMQKHVDPEAHMAGRSSVRFGCLLSPQQLRGGTRGWVGANTRFGHMLEVNS